MQKKLVFGISEDDDPKEVMDEITVEVYKFLERKESKPDSPATSKQIWKLKSLGYVGRPEILTKLEASSKISELEGK